MVAFDFPGSECPLWTANPLGAFGKDCHLECWITEGSFENTVNFVSVITSDVLMACHVSANAYLAQRPIWRT